MNAMNVGKPSVSTQTSLNIRKLTLGRNLMIVLNVENPLVTGHPWLNI